MDRRRHRPFLNPLLLVGSGVALLSFAGNLPAQDATLGAASPSASATPWVQASPPPGMASATPKPAVEPARTPRPPKAPKPAASPSVAPSPDDVAREMMHRRLEEQHTQIVDKAAQQGAKDGKKEAARVEQLPPDERAAYQRNLPLWRQMPPEEREDLRRQANERVRQETDKAYEVSGLNLDPDQREVFDLRYKQERRKVEHELQEKANAERARRLAEVNERLKREFAARSAASQNADTPTPKKAPTPPAPANPDATPTPGFMR